MTTATRSAADADVADAPAAPLRTIATARWPGPTDSPADLPPIPGFVLSTFNPLVAAVADRCLAMAPEPPPARTAVLLASATADLTTAEALAEAVGTGRRVPPLLFFQSNPNAILGHVAARHRLLGPVVCLGPAPDGRPATLDRLAAGEAALLLLDGDADAVLVLRVEQRTPAGPDRAVAHLVVLDIPKEDI